MSRMSRIFLIAPQVTDFITPPDLDQARLNKCLIALVNRKVVQKDNSTVSWFLNDIQWSYIIFCRAPRTVLLERNTLISTLHHSMLTQDCLDAVLREGYSGSYHLILTYGYLLILSVVWLMYSEDDPAENTVAAPCSPIWRQRQLEAFPVVYWSDKCSIHVITGRRDAPHAKFSVSSIFSTTSIL
jgi:hypothetical protein